MAEVEQSSARYCRRPQWSRVAPAYRKRTVEMFYEWSSDMPSQSHGIGCDILHFTKHFSGSCTTRCNNDASHVGSAGALPADVFCQWLATRLGEQSSWWCLQSGALEKWNHKGHLQALHAETHCVLRNKEPFSKKFVKKRKNDKQHKTKLVSKPSGKASEKLFFLPRSRSTWTFSSS